MSINEFAAELRNLKPGYRFVGRIPVRVSIRQMLCGGPKMTMPQRIYTVFGREFSVALQAAVWALE